MVRPDDKKHGAAEPPDEERRASQASPPPKTEDKAPGLRTMVQGLALFSFMSGTFVGSVLLGIAAAWWLDSQFGLGGLWYPLGLIGGIGTGGWSIYRELRRRGVI